MRILLLSLLIACSRPSPAPQPASNTEASTQAAAAPAAPGATAADPIASIRTADRAEIHWLALDRKEERTGAELKALLDALVVSEQMPSGGKATAYITFYKGSTELGQVWAYHDGEWGIKGVNKTQGLSPQLAQLLKR